MNTIKNRKGFTIIEVHHRDHRADRRRTRMVDHGRARDNE